jgi:ABC-2 type transport system permease protein
MKINPIYKREMAVGSKSSRLALVITVFNAALALVILMYINAVLNQAKNAGGVQYSSFLSAFRYAAWIEFIMILFIMPSQTAGCISGERERKTLDLILTTQMKPSDIILGKLMTAFSTAFVIVLSGVPVIAMTFAYGGIRALDFLIVVLSLLTEAFFAGSMGIWFSAFCRRTPVAMAAAYGAVALLSGGTFGINMLFKNFTAASSETVSLLLFSPVSTFYAAVSSVTGAYDAAGLLSSWFGVRDIPFLTGHWFLLGTVLQFLFSCILTVSSACMLKPKRNRNAAKRDGTDR